MSIYKIALLLVVTLLLASSANADSIRCGSHVIQDGGLENIPTMKEVIQKCGQPSSWEGQKLYYKEKGKRLDFDSEGRLIAIHDIETD